MRIARFIGVYEGKFRGPGFAHDHRPRFAQQFHDPGDLFAETTEIEKEATPFHETDEFIFALKFTHIHLFGMSGIFILMGVIVLFLDTSFRMRTWLMFLLRCVPAGGSLDFGEPSYARTPRAPLPG